MSQIKRSYNPGSEWIYYKIFTGPKTADLLLTNLIKPVVDKLYKKNLIEKWFFIRYADPKFHLRIRFKVTNIGNVGEIISEFSTLSESLIEKDLIWKIQLDTYQREIERYGISTMEASETLFFYDSEMIVHLLDLIDDSDEGEELRWLFGIRAIDSFLYDFNLSENDKLVLLEQLKINFCAEFNMNRFLKKQLDKKFIAHEKKIMQFIEMSRDDGSELTPLINIIHKKSGNNATVINDITNIIEPEKLNSFLGSHIHMIMNRLFRSKNRLYEMVVYYFLFKYYKAAIGKRKYKMKLIAS